MPRDLTKVYCTGCRMPNFPHTTLEAGRPETVILSKVSEDGTGTARIPLGFLSELFGHDDLTDTWGLDRTSVTMLAGEPGTGKTTLFMMLCDWVLDVFSGPKDEALYIANEQSPRQLKAYARRLKIRNWDRVRVYDAMGQGLRRPLEAIVEEFKPRLCILDSLSNLLKVYGAGPEEGIEVVNAFTELSSKHEMPSLIVNQVTKDGQHAGFNDVLHAGGTILNFNLDEVTKIRMIWSSKNRFGEAPITVHMRMRPEGSDRPGWLDPVEGLGEDGEPEE